eukprot:SAG11_NODE_25905_length_352_cov_0.996047_1_plen_73_part_01
MPAIDKIGILFGDGPDPSVDGGCATTAFGHAYPHRPAEVREAVYSQIKAVFDEVGPQLFYGSLPPNSTTVAVA